MNYTREERVRSQSLGTDPSEWQERVSPGTRAVRTRERSLVAQEMTRASRVASPLLALLLEPATGETRVD